MDSPNAPHDNRLLAALPSADFERLASHLEIFPLRLGETLHGPGDELQHAYFPTTAIVSLLYVTESGASAEIASVGNEGLLGISLFMGGNTTPSSAVVQTAGVSYRLNANVLQKEFKLGGNTRNHRSPQAQRGEAGKATHGVISHASSLRHGSGLPGQCRETRRGAEPWVKPFHRLPCRVKAGLHGVRLPLGKHTQQPGCRTVTGAAPDYAGEAVAAIITPS